MLTGRVAPTWSLIGAQAATITSSGLLTGVAPGQVAVAATIEGVTGSTNLTVNPPPAPVASVNVSLGATPIMVGQSTQGAAITRDAAGNILTGRVITWSTNPAAVAGVSSFGLVSGLTIGNANVTATSEGQTGQAGITVIAPTSFGTGTRVVGVNIGPGLYRSNNLPAVSCYWERLSGFGGSLPEIIANDFARGPAVVAISGTDKGFGSTGCGTWVLVTGPITSSPTAPFADGTFIVGTDIAVGTWQSNGSGSSCYWARFRGFSGLLADIIANFFGSAPAVVTIAGTDQGFNSQGCGTWTKIG